MLEVDFEGGIASKETFQFVFKYDHSLKYHLVGRVFDAFLYKDNSFNLCTETVYNFSTNFVGK